MKLSWLAMVFAICVSTPSFSANWLELQNSESAEAAPYTLWGFFQPQYVRNLGGRVQEISAPAALQQYNGQTAVFNLVGPDLAHTDQLQIFRLRGGMRGVMPSSDKKINYFVLAEFGNNGLTRERHAVLTDASLTFNYLPGARIRIGLGRLPLGEEAFQGIQTLDYINFTNATDLLLNERFVKPYSSSRATSPVLGVPMASSSINGPVSGFQDLGIEVFDWFRQGPWEYSYAAMLGTGNGINFSGDDGNKDLTVHLRASYVFGGRGAKREDASVYIWRQAGKREFAENAYERVREGIGFRYFKNPWRISGEYMRARGMIFIGPTPPFNDVGGNAFEPVTLMALDQSNTAAGYYLDIGWKFAPQWEADFRYDRLSRLTNSPFDERRFSTWTLGAQYFFNQKLRLALNYEIRELKMPYPDAAGLSGSALAQQIQIQNGTIIGDSLGNRISAQLTYIF